MFTTFLFEVELNLVNILKHFISDVDECQMSTHNCSDNATCINTEGSLTVDANQGTEEMVTTVQVGVQL